MLHKHISADILLIREKYSGTFEDSWKNTKDFNRSWKETFAVKVKYWTCFLLSEILIAYFNIRDLTVGSPSSAHLIQQNKLQQIFSPERVTRSCPGLFTSAFIFFKQGFCSTNKMEMKEDSRYQRVKLFTTWEPNYYFLNATLKINFKNFIIGMFLFFKLLYLKKKIVSLFEKMLEMYKQVQSRWKTPICAINTIFVDKLLLYQYI